MKFKKTSLLGLVVAFILIGTAATVFVKGTAGHVPQMTRVHSIIHINHGIFTIDPGSNEVTIIRSTDGRDIIGLYDDFDPDYVNYISSMPVKYIVNGVKKSVALEHYEGIVMTTWMSSE